MKTTYRFYCLRDDTAWCTRSLHATVTFGLHGSTSSQHCLSKALIKWLERQGSSHSAEIEPVWSEDSQLRCMSGVSLSIIHLSRSSSSAEARCDRHRALLRLKGRSVTILGLYWLRYGVVARSFVSTTCFSRHALIWRQLSLKSLLVTYFWRLVRTKLRILI